MPEVPAISMSLTRDATCDPGGGLELRRGGLEHQGLGGAPVAAALESPRWHPWLSKWDTNFFLGLHIPLLVSFSACRCFLFVFYYWYWIVYFNNSYLIYDQFNVLSIICIEINENMLNQCNGLLTTIR
jgi:hypothetical protein